MKKTPLSSGVKEVKRFKNSRKSFTCFSPPLQAPSIQKAQPTWQSLGGVIKVVLGSLRSPTEAEQRELRAMWWRQRRLGHTFPAQRGVIVIDGGRP